jgi:hypothetical protein
MDAASRTALDGVCLTEHRGQWDRLEFATLQQENPQLILVNAMEVDLPLCHLTVFGLDRAAAGLRDPAVLRRVADDEGAVVVLAHPFRYFLSQPSNNLLFGSRGPVSEADLLTHPIFDLVDAIEVANGGTSAAENALALKVAKLLRKPTVGGSDAHSRHGLGHFLTILDDQVRDSDSFLTALRAARFHAATRDEHGELIHCR